MKIYEYSKLFYCYFWLRQDYSPYYVGKGFGDRAIEDHGGGFKAPDKTRIVVKYYSSEKEALEAEKFFIAYFGRKDLKTGCLRNLTDGGEGVAGLKHSEETKLLLRQTAITNNTKPPSRLGFVMSQEEKVIHSIAAKNNGVKFPDRRGMKRSASAIEKFRKTMLEVWEKKRINGTTKHSKPHPIKGKKHKNPSPLIGRKRDPISVQKGLETKRLQKQSSKSEAA